MVINTWDKNREIFEKIFIRILKKREREKKTKIEDIPFTFEIVYRKINQTKQGNASHLKCSKFKDQRTEKTGIKSIKMIIYIY